MGLTGRSTGMSLMQDIGKLKVHPEKEFVVTLAGNPNVGKSTVFNCLTGLNQHTGNWPGKTVSNARGVYSHKDRMFMLVDVPGTYSMMSNSTEEEVARNFICFGNPRATVIVTDATCLERNLNLVLQILEMTPHVVICVNLMDEAKKKRIHIDTKVLAECLGVPVIGTNARNKEGLEELLDAIYDVAIRNIETKPFRVTYHEAIEKAVEKIEGYVLEGLGEKVDSRWVSLRLLEGDDSILDDLKAYLGYDLLQDLKLKEILEQEKALLSEQGIGTDMYRDMIVSSIVFRAEGISRKAVTCENERYNETDRKIDRVLTSKVFGIPIMILLLGFIFWLTITGANYPSSLIASGLFKIEEQLSRFFILINMPVWLHNMVVLGIYRTLAWVISVMLPPMAIFFPLFTLLEDLGYLPRVAFNLDNFFKKACAHGKQALTMCMGFGCNAAGVIGCRIIDSPRERLIATVTNNFVPCNGRFPTLIAISTIFFGGIAAGFSKSVVPTMMVTGIILLGVMMTLAVSKILSKTILKGIPSSFTLELPPYRRPQAGKIFVRSIFDRTLFVLGRAITIAIPAGLVIWIMANVEITGISLLAYCADFLDPFARLIGMDGYILMAFILGLPANEIVLPIILMSYMSAGNMLEYESLEQLGNLLKSNGWTHITAVCVMLFSLMHFPCGTTLWTIRKETQSSRWTLISFLVPTVSGIILCFVLAQLARLIGWA